jgi:outer membrane lipoprotein SlyB
MKVKAIVALLVALVFTLGVVGMAFATAEVKGTVTKIDGKKITVKDAAGKETTVEVKDTAGVKVGDSVTIKDGTVTVEKKKKKAIEGC